MVKNLKILESEENSEYWVESSRINRCFQQWNLIQLSNWKQRSEMIQLV